MKFIIKNYIDKINVSDIINFGKENGITVDNYEASILKMHLKNNWEELLYGDPIPIIKDIEDKLGSKSKKIETLFYTYKDKYKNYL